MSHSQEFVEYTWDIQPNQNILFLIDTLMGNVNVLAPHLPLPTTEEYLLNNSGKEKQIVQLNPGQKRIRHAMVNARRPLYPELLRGYTEEERKMHLLHDFMINKVGQTMPVEQYQRWWIEVWIARNVDSLQYYLSRILFRIYTERPDTLKTSENKVEIREVLEAGTMEEFINNCAEQKVSVLAYKGLPNA